MDAPTPGSEDDAAEVFAVFLERAEAGEDVRFEDLCARHPGLEPSLRRIHLHWRALSDAFAAMAVPAAGDRGAATTPMSSLLSRLGGDRTRLSRYALGPELASGAMGRIVQAWDEELRREVAIKFQRERDDGARAQRRFLEEAQIAAQLDHPGIVPIHELGLDEAGCPFFAMRLVRGRDLGEVLALQANGDEGWTRTRVIGVLLRVCEAMAFAHDKGVVHRDLKPGNVMVGRFGETYVMDWGLARVLGRERSAGDAVRTVGSDIATEDGVSPLLTRAGEVVGTPPYMAPEQAAGGPDVADPRVDVYSIGAILYHLLAGHAPYAETASRVGDDVVDAVRGGPPEPLPDDVPPELRAICERAMARRPDARYQTIEDLGEDLRAFLELRVVSAYATGRFAELRKWIARNRALSASVAVLVLAIAVFAAVASQLWVTAVRDRARADQSASGLATELERSRFKAARLSLQLDDWAGAQAVLWQQHFAGTMPRSTSWALQELVMGTPCLVTQPLAGNLPVVFVPGRRLFAVGEEDGSLATFAAGTLAPSQHLAAGGAPLTRLSASANGTAVLACAADGSVWSFDLAAGAAREIPSARGAWTVALAPDGVAFATGADAGGAVRYWPRPDAAPEPVCRLTARIKAIAFDRSGERVLAGDDDGNLAFTALPGGGEQRLSLGGPITVISVAPSGHQAWVGVGHSVAVVDLDRLCEVRRLPTRNGTCRDLVHESDDSVLVGGWWRIDRFRHGGDVVEPVSQLGVWQFDLDREGHRLATSSGRFGLRLLDTSGGGRRAFAGRLIALSADGRRAAQLDGDRMVVCDVTTGAVLAEVPCRQPVLSAVLDGGGRRLAVAAGRDAKIAVVDVDAGKTVRETDGPEEAPLLASVLLSADGTTLDTVIGPDRVRRVDVTSGAVLGEVAVPGKEILRVAAAPGGRVAVLVRTSTTVRIFSLPDGACEEVTFPDTVAGEPVGSIASVAFATGGDLIAVGTWTGHVFMRDRRSGETRGFKAHAGTVWSVSFLPGDPQLLFSSGGANGIALWDLDTGNCCYQALRSEAPVSRVQLSDDGQTLAAAVRDGSVVLDLAYWQRHVAGELGDAAAALPAGALANPRRLAELRAWAAGVLAQPWPRWSP